MIAGEITIPIAVTLKALLYKAVGPTKIIKVEMGEDDKFGEVYFRQRPFHKVKKTWWLGLKVSMDGSNIIFNELSNNKDYIFDISDPKSFNKIKKYLTKHRKCIASNECDGMVRCLKLIIQDPAIQCQWTVAKKKMNAMAIQYRLPRNPGGR